MEYETDGLVIMTEIPAGHKIITEGKAKILYPANEDGDVPVSGLLLLLIIIS